MKKPFIHLRAHSAYSLLEGALHVKDLIACAVADKQPAMALTDNTNLFGALEFSQKAAEKGLQPIIGCSLPILFDHEENEIKKEVLGDHLPSLVFIVQNEEGYQNLLKLVSAAYLSSAIEGKPSIKTSFLQHHKEGLIVLTGGVHGPIAECFLRKKGGDVARERLRFLKNIFQNNLYIEIQRHGLEDEKKTEAEQIALAYEANIALVATNQCYFKKADDFEAHDALMCIASGRVVGDSTRPKKTPEFYFKSQEEMRHLFRDVPEAIENTCHIAQQIYYRPKTCAPLLPRFVKAKGKKDESQEDILSIEANELRVQAQKGLEERLKHHPLAQGLTRQDYDERLEYELGVIENMQFPGYFLIVADFIQWAKQQDIPVGPGRGSGAGSLVAWSLTITDLDPMRFSLLFERFLNPDRVSMPDFDIDFCQDRRDEVIQYVQERYGKDRVAQIITFGSLQARAVLRDVGRVLQMPYGQVDRLCKMVPSNPANPTTLPEAIEQEPRLRNEARQEEIVKKLLDIGQKLEGLFRHASTHAAGIVIGDRPLNELVPLFRDPRSEMPVTQFNMKWVEQAGLVKFDFLGLKTLTVINRACALLKKRNIDLDIATIPLDDEKSYQLYAKGKTIGVFQVESAGMRRALIDMKPDVFEDIIALVALYRPGPMDNIPIFNARKHGDEEVEYLHPELEPILKETQGIIVYQEQVMQIAQTLSGYSLGEADLLRRAMGKKIRAEMEQQKERFIEGAKKRELTAKQADEIFEAVAKFANYGFNKSHAAAYALVSYQTAYLKANYPAEFIAASMSLDMHNTDKISEFRREAINLDIEVQAPNINSSGVDFDVVDGRIFYALSALKGVGQQAAEYIVQERAEKGAFKSIDDFASRFNPRILNKRCLESLILAGSFDDLHKDRAILMANIDQMTALAQSYMQDKAAGQGGLFGGDDTHQSIQLEPVTPYTNAEKLNLELKSVGFYISAHPLEEYEKKLTTMHISPWHDFHHAVTHQGASSGRLAGVIMSYQERKTKSGKRIAIVEFSDKTSHFEAVIFADMLAEMGDALEVGKAFIIGVTASYQDEEVRLRVQRLELLAANVDQPLTHVIINMHNEGAAHELSEKIQKTPEGQTSITFILKSELNKYHIELPNNYTLFSADLEKIRNIENVNSITQHS